MYFELHDILFLMSVIESKYKIDTCKALSIATCSRTRRTAVNEFIIPRIRLRRCDENFWVRADVLFNVMRRHLFKRKETLTSKKTITAVFWDYFRNYFNENVMCTWRFYSLRRLQYTLKTDKPVPIWKIMAANPWAQALKTLLLLLLLYI